MRSVYATTQSGRFQRAPMRKHVEVPTCATERSAEAFVIKIKFATFMVSGEQLILSSPVTIFSYKQSIPQLLSRISIFSPYTNLFRICSRQNMNQTRCSVEPYHGRSRLVAERRPASRRFQRFRVEFATPLKSRTPERTCHFRQIHKCQANWNYIKEGNYFPQTLVKRRLISQKPSNAPRGIDIVLSAMTSNFFLSVAFDATFLMFVTYQCVTMHSPACIIISMPSLVAAW